MDIISLGDFKKYIISDSDIVCSILTAKKMYEII